MIYLRLLGIFDRMILNRKVEEHSLLKSFDLLFVYGDNLY